MRRIRQIMVDEPLIPFALIGAVLFVVYGFSRPDDSVETIEVRPATLRRWRHGKSLPSGRECSRR